MTKKEVLEKVMTDAQFEQYTKLLDINKKSAIKE